MLTAHVQTEHVFYVLALKPDHHQPSPHCACHHLPLSNMLVLQSSAASDGRSGAAVCTAVNPLHQSRHSAAGLLRPDQNGDHLSACHTPSHTGTQTQPLPHDAIEPASCLSLCLVLKPYKVIVIVSFR